MVILVSPSSKSARCAIEFGAALPLPSPVVVTSAAGGGSHLLEIADFKVDTGMVGKSDSQVA